MVTPATTNLEPPSSWGEFEDMCADLFSIEWGDTNTTRYGRSGQRQNGVDVYGRLSDGRYAAVQCKGRSTWPPRRLKTKDIDSEVALARGFVPALAEFTIATTAPNDNKLQDHARALTEKHEKEGFFSVHIVGWTEIA